MSTEKKDTDNDSFPEENNLDDQTAVDGLDESDQEEDSEVSSPQENLYDLMADFFVNENGDKTKRSRIKSWALILTRHI